MAAIAQPESRAAADRSAKGAILRLSVAQALSGANASVIYATGAIVGATLSPNPALATLPISVFVVGMAAGTLPNGFLARRFGRRTAFMAGAGCGIAAGLLGALALLLGALPLYCAATFMGGLYAAVIQSFRFAAADGASPALRPKALSWVMAGGVFSGVLGPQIVTWTMNLWQPYLFVASYLAQAAVALLAMAVLAGVNLPRPAPAELAAGRPLGVIVRQRRFLAAAVCGVVAYTMMNLVMTSAPLAMHMCGLTLSASNLAIQWHVVAMYAPSFFTGALIARFGAPRVVACGFALTVAAALTGVTGVTVAHFWGGLVLLGLGWNFAFIGASAMVLQAHRPEERNKVQAFNDFLVFGTMAVGSFSSGAVLAGYGWGAVNRIVFPPIAFALIVLAASGSFRRRVATAI